MPTSEVMDPANSSVGITIANNAAMTQSTVTWASNPNSTAFGFSRSVGTQNIGKVYFDFTVNRGVIGADGIVVGFGTSLMPTDGSALVGNASSGGASLGVGWENSQLAFMNGGVLTAFNNYIATYGQALTAMTCAVAIDFTLGFWWTQVFGVGQSGVWSGYQALRLDPRFPPGFNITEPTPGDPTTDYNGIPFSNIITGPNFYAFVGFKTLLDSVTINWSGLLPPPPGYTPWVPPVPPTPPTPPTPTPAPTSPLGKFPPFGPDYPIPNGPVYPVLYD